MTRTLKMTVKKPNIIKKKVWKQKTWTKFMSQLPCKDGCMSHYPCFLWETGSEVRMRKFLFIKWLEFTKETYYE